MEVDSQKQPAAPLAYPGFHTLAHVLLFVLALGAAPATAGPPTFDQAAQFFGLTDATVTRILDGEVVATSLEASSDKDLSLAVVARLNAPRDEVYAFVHTDALAQTQTVTLSSGRIDPRDPKASLADLELDAATLASLVRDPAGTFHMSDAEAERLRQADPSGVLDAYREVLAERAAAYWERGLPGVLPYAGSGRSPAADLTAALGATALLSMVPTLQAELAAPPAESRGAAEHQLFWAVQKGRDQAAPVLFHRALYQDADGEVFFERRFYSAYDYDALQITAGVVPTAGGGCAIFYVNRTFTSQVAGFGGAAKRSIGRQLLQKELVAELQRIQQALQGTVLRN